MTATVARIPVEGTYNLRDVGGLPAVGGRTAHGRLYRSDGLHSLTERGAEALADLGIRTVVDLRSDHELASQQSRHGIARTVHVPVFDDAAPTGTLVLDEVYTQIIEDSGERLVEAVRQIATADEGPVLVHCTAGKDRTGIVVALALLAAKVDREAVVADYAATQANLEGSWERSMLDQVRALGHEPSEEVRRLVVASPPELMRALIERLDRDWGGPAAYLGAHGMQRHELARLRDALIDTTAATAAPYTTEGIPA